jgi:hypothetical protein
MNYIIDRLAESSTWRGLIGIATALGVAFNPEQVASIIAAGTALIGVINVFRVQPAAK